MADIRRWTQDATNETLDINQEHALESIKH